MPIQSHNQDLAKKFIKLAATIFAVNRLSASMCLREYRTQLLFFLLDETMVKS